MDGVHASTGAGIDGIDRLRQSVRDILTTPVGSRVMRPEYGSRVPRLVDAPANKGTAAAIIAESAAALRRWEPELRLERVEVDAAAAGHVTLALEGWWIPEETAVRLDGIVV